MLLDESVFLQPEGKIVSAPGNITILEELVYCALRQYR